MTLLTISSHAAATKPPQHAIAETALRRWAAHRLRRELRPDGGITFAFTLSGSTCNNLPLEVIMTVAVDAAGRIESASARPAASDRGCDAMCSAQGNGARFLKEAGDCKEVIGLTIAEAAARDWLEEPSGCFCNPGNRRHKWRNVFQTIHYALIQSVESEGQ